MPVLHNNRSKRHDPEEGVKDIVQPRHVEQYELSVVPFTDTCSHPDTVMIVACDTDGALRAMYAIRWLPDLATVAETIIVPVVVVVCGDGTFTVKTYPWVTETNFGKSPST